MRWADFGPIPGSLPSSSIRLSTAPSYTVVPFLRYGVKFGCAIRVALFYQTRIEDICADAATGQPGVFDDFVVIRGVIVVIVIRSFFFLGRRLSFRAGGRSPAILRHHVG